MLFSLLLLLAGSAPSTPAPAGDSMSTLPGLQAQAMRIDERMDLDHDTFVTFDEQIKATSAMVGKPIDLPPPATSFIQTLFDEGDANHDGRISAEENRAGVERQFKLTDADHDGVITRQEYMAAAMASAERLVDAMRAARQVPSPSE